MNQSGLPCIGLSVLLLFREFWDSRPSGATKVTARNGMASWANRIRSWQTWKASKAGYMLMMRLMRSDSTHMFQTCSNFQLCFLRINAETTATETKMFLVLIFCFKFKFDFLSLLLEVTVMPWVSMLEDPNFLSSREPMGLGGTKICGWSDFGIAKSEVSGLIRVTLSLRIWYKVYKHIMI